MNTRNDIRTAQEQRLQQRLVPQQVRYVKLLEMTGPEIEDEVRRELDENPALENVSSSMPAENGAQSDDLPAYRYYANNHSADDSHFDHIAVNAGETLQEAMLRQLADLTLTPRQRTIASYIIGNIDNNGYLTRHIDLIASDIGVKEGIDADDDEMRGMFNVVRSLDPAGAGAVDLRDCLLLQLRRRDSSDPNTRLATIMVSDYFDLFSKRHFDRLRMALDITPEQMTGIQGIIRSLNPKPGSTFNSEGSTPASHTVIPDFVVETDDERISVSVNNNLPELRIEESFNIDTPNDEAGTFIRRKRDDAVTFIKMLELRQQTLLNVMKAIVKLQKDFFTTGEDESRLRPMILRDVAALTGLDLSVISRATAGKWVATNFNIYPLKMFFNERVTDDNLSSHEIIAAIREIIDSEDKRHPLSDEAITTRLESKGYPVARRTVAKYREKSGIPVARLRREI